MSIKNDTSDDMSKQLGLQFLPYITLYFLLSQSSLSSMGRVMNISLCSFFTNNSVATKCSSVLYAAPHATTCSITCSMVIPPCLLDTKEDANLEIFEMCSWITRVVLLLGFLVGFSKITLAFFLPLSVTGVTS